MRKSIQTQATRLVLCGALVILGQSSAAFGSLLFDASLRNGDYDGGAAIDTMDPNHGGSPHVLGIVDSPDGVTFTSTETNGRSNALVNWVIGGNRDSFRNSGTVSFWLRADREAHVSGGLFGDNYGFNGFRHGQGTFGAFASRLANDEGIADDQVRITLTAWHNNVWYNVNDPVTLEYDRWYNIGFAWGGPGNDYEIWVNAAPLSEYDLPAGVSLPWGMSTSGVNFGLGDNHERGYDAYGSVAGMTFADMHIWDEYRQTGDTVIPEPTTFALLALGGIGLLRRRRT